jgi:ubiquitin carboxyl-terminal hydrolase 7
MNAMLQSLFHIAAFRLLVFQMGTTGAEDSGRSIPLNLQRLFCRMQLSERACSTRALIQAFGWNAQEAVIQHDTEEFCRVLLENHQTNMANTGLEERIPQLLRGRFRSFVRCPTVGYESAREEDFSDLEMQVRDCRTLAESFARYVALERLDSENQSDTGEFGKQDAFFEDGVSVLPPASSASPPAAVRVRL